MKRKNLSIALFIAMFGLTAQAQQAMHVSYDEHARMNHPEGLDQETRELQHRLFEQQAKEMNSENQEQMQKHAPKRTANADGGSLLLDSYIKYNADGSYSSKRVYNYNENGSQRMFVHYDWKDGEWVTSSKDEYSYDENGNQILGVSYKWKDGKWATSFKYEYSYDEHGNETMYASYNWQDGEWVGSLKYEYSYDEYGNQTMSASYYDWQDGEWVGSTKSESAYDEYGNEILDASYKWKNGEWVGSYKYESSYDENGNQILYAYYNGWQDGEWVGSHKLESSYDEKGNQTMKAYYDGWQDGEWVGDYKYEYSYDEYGNEIMYVSYDWNGGKWVRDFSNSFIVDNDVDYLGNLISTIKYYSGGSPYEKYEYAYDEYGNKTLNARYNWKDGEWVGSYKDEYSYDEYGNETLNARYYWQDGEWVGSYKDEYSYDENGNQTMYIHYNWKDGEWVSSYKTEYSYDEYGNETLLASYNWKDGEWVGSHKFESSYDEYGNETMSASYFDWQNGKWVGSYKYEYSYDEYGNQTMFVRYDWKDGEWVESYYTIYYYSDHSLNTQLVAEATLQMAPIATVANDDVNGTDKMLQFSIAGTPTKYNEIEADIYFPVALDPRTSSDIVMGEGLPYSSVEDGSKTYSHTIDFTEASAEKQDMPGYVRHHLHISSTDSKQFTDNNLFSIYCGTKNVEDNFYPVILRNITLSNDGLDNATTPLESSYVKIGNPAKGTLALQGYIPEIVTNALETETAIKSLDLTSVTAISGDFTYMVGRNVVAPASVDASVKFIAPLAGSYSSFCAPVEVEIPCYTFSKIENGLAYFTEATYAPANEAVIINTAVNTIAQSMTLLSVAGKEVTSGYYVSNNGTEFHSVNGKAVIPALRGCFELPATSNLRIAIETPTGIEVIGSAAEVFGNPYDLQGRQITHAKNGIYVVNGKKQYVK